MTLLTICQDVIKDIPLSVPTSIVGNTEETAQLVLACAQREGKSLMRRHNWTVLQEEHSFSTVASTEAYALPTDFDRFENDTLWDRSNYEHLRGPLSASQWQEYKSSILQSTNTVWKRFRVKGSTSTQFYIHPTPDAVETIVFEYISNQFCESSGGTGQAAWAADADVPRLDDELLTLGIRWRTLNRLGMEYTEEKREYETEVNKAIARDGGAPALSMTTRRRFQLLGPQNVPETGYG